MRWLEAKIPPLIVLALLGGAAHLARHYAPSLSFYLPLAELVAILVAIVGAALNLLPKLAFGRGNTTINPLSPALATCLVTSGIYRYTRNPMYVGQALILLGWVLYLRNTAALLAVPAFVLYITWFQIRPEERYLSSRFPDEYATFSRRVSRWL